MAQIVTAFAVPMAMHRIEDGQALNRELEELFVRRAAKD